MDFSLYLIVFSRVIGLVSIILLMAYVYKTCLKKHIQHVSPSQLWIHQTREGTFVHERDFFYKKCDKIEMVDQSSVKLSYFDERLQKNILVLLSLKLDKINILKFSRHFGSKYFGNHDFLRDLFKPVFSECLKNFEVDNSGRDMKDFLESNIDYYKIDSLVIE